MRKSVLVLALLIAGCGLLPDDKADETAGWSAERLYAASKEAMADRDWSKAIKYLEKLEARYPYGRFAQQAQLDAAYAYWKDGERASALAAVERFVKMYPNHDNVDYAIYLKGLINFNDNLGIMGFIDNPNMAERDPKGAREAFATFKELVERFPNSKYAEDSAARMRFLVNALSQHEVFVARYYMRRGAYIAAANRAQFAVQNYPRTPATEEAVFIMVKAYDALGMTELRDSADRVMRSNFPNSKYLTGKVKRDVPWWKLWDPEW
jgi:outer membrane protein assembly factor BamD